MEKREIKFSKLIEKSHKSKIKTLLELFKENCEVKKNLELKVKIVNKNLIAQLYAQAHQAVMALNEAMFMQTKGSRKILEQINNNSAHQEIEYLFNILNLYCDGVVFEIEGDLEKRIGEYDLLFTSGIYDYIYTQCHEDYDNFIRMIQNDIYSSLNMTSLTVLKILMNEFANSIDLNALSGLKEELKSISQTEGFKELSDISKNVK